MDEIIEQMTLEDIERVLTDMSFVWKREMPEVQKKFWEEIWKKCYERFTLLVEKKNDDIWL